LQKGEVMSVDIESTKKTSMSLKRNEERYTRDTNIERRV
jgi:hypothetical protein